MLLPKSRLLSCVKNKIFGKDLLIISCISIILTFLLIIELSSATIFNISLMPGSDMYTYISHANGILNGEWPKAEPFYRAPFFSYALAFMGLIGTTHVGVTLIQAILFSFSVGLVMMTAQLEIGRLGGWIAGILLLFYGGAACWIIVLHSTIMELFLASLLLFLITAFRFFEYKATDILATDIDLQNTEIGAATLESHPQKITSDSFFLSATIGLIFAALCLVRPNFLILFPVLLVGLFLESNVNQRANVIKLITIIIIFFAIPITAVVVRNNIHSDKIVFISTNGFPTYKSANSEQSTVFNFRYTDSPLMSPVKLQFWKHQLKKAIGFWWSVEYSQNINFYIIKNNSSLLNVMFIPFGFIGSLFLTVTIIFLARSRQYWSYQLFFWGFYLTVVAFYIIGRYRIPALPFMIVYSSIGIVMLIDKWKNRNTKTVMIAALCCITLTAVSQPFAKHINNADRYNTGRTALEFGAIPEAISYFEIVYENIGYRDCAKLLISSIVMSGDVEGALAKANHFRINNPYDVEMAKVQYSVLQLTGSNAEMEKLDKMYGQQLGTNSVRNLLKETIDKYTRKYEKQDLESDAIIYKKLK